MRVRAAVIPLLVWVYLHLIRELLRFPLAFLPIVRGLGVQKTAAFYPNFIRIAVGIMTEPNLLHINTIAA